MQTLRAQVAVLNQQLQKLEEKLDRKGGAALPNPAALGSSSSEPAVSAYSAKPPAIEKQAPSGGTAARSAASPNPVHGFLERKPGDKVTFFVPGGELTAYGNLDVSVDATTKGIAGEIGPDNNPPVGNMGWMPALSTNLSYFGVRGSQSLNGLPFKFIYQLETQLDIAATSGALETNSNQSNVVKGGLTSRNSYIGISSSQWGSLMLGKTDAPYKNSTAKFNPFYAMIGDYQVIMANTGGDNRVEFGTRLDHSIWYQSPNWHGFVFDALVSPGQNRAYNSDNIAAGESDCTGGNIPGSGGTVPVSCSDGSFGLAASASVSYTKGGLYGTAAYERHENVNRSSDITGLYPSGNVFSQLLVAQDVAAEDAGKFGLLYAFKTKTTIGGIFETLHRYVPADLQFQNERQRNGTWFFASQGLGHNFSAHFGWAHAFRAPGDPGQHNDSNAVPPGGDPATDATAGAGVDNSANMFTFAVKNKLSKSLTAYFDWAYTANGPAAHFDLGAGGRSVTTDCHDAFGATGGLTSNPHCWTGGNLMGVSAGLNLKF
ncbi:MAG: porin [Acidobacteria bacterium]|nr:porin [Acidobacteriota bacterium]MBS1866938.1 porin [Acidobacteriota bacterium]